MSHPTPDRVKGARPPRALRQFDDLQQLHAPEGDAYHADLAVDQFQVVGRHLQLSLRQVQHLAADLQDGLDDSGPDAVAGRAAGRDRRGRRCRRIGTQHPNPLR